jgi:hypothetical protein
MNVNVKSPPAPGVAIAGDLYVDLQSKQMWLGVDTTVDPTGAVLLSDIMAIQPAINSSLTTAKAYTDGQVATRALLVHTHTHSDITDFNAAVMSVVTTQPGAKAWTKGMICMYSGSMADIGVGDLAGWNLCDGSNGTPDLRDRFVIGAGNLSNNFKNTPVDITTSAAGAHRHNNTAVTLDQSQIPSHQHYCSLSGSGSGSGGTDAQGQHNHPMTGSSADNGDPGNYIETGYSQAWGTVYTGDAGNHSHNVSVNVNISAAGWSNATGGSGAHNHAMDDAPSHTHVATISTVKGAIAYYALAFIMKL